MEIASGYSIGTNTGKVNPYTVASAVNMVRFLMDSKRGFLLQCDITTRVFARYFDDFRKLYLENLILLLRQTRNSEDVRI